jgi:redox-sensitive bicupin YhaK (pirin superfamily)
MGFSALRVINDDLVTPGAGFDTHGHRDMEIISYVLEGTIEHKDSQGNIETLPAGEFQLMSAGRGILHSEYNASKTDNLKFLQIWIQPNTLGGSPGYQQKRFGKDAGMTTIVSPTGENGSLQIKQDAKLHQLVLAAKQNITFKPDSPNIYVHLVAGELSINGTTMVSGDGAKITDAAELSFNNVNDNEVTALVFELP